MRSNTTSYLNLNLHLFQIKKLPCEATAFTDLHTMYLHINTLHGGPFAPTC